MTNDEVKRRLIHIEATKYKDRAGPSDVRRRGSNYIEKEDPHRSEAFDDFFDYEKEFTDLTPARDTIAAGSDIDRVTNSMSASVSRETKKKMDPSFVIMERLPEEKPINTINESISVPANKPAFEFIQCNFEKDDGNRCKKQAKRGQEYCGIHRRFIEKNNL